MSTNQSELENKKIVSQYKILLRNLKDRLKPIDRNSLKQALKMAIEAHKDMRRKSGEPYILHPIAVANICVQEIGLGVRSSICALLHDTVEDTEITIEDIQREFGNEITKIVDGLTKISSVSDSSKSEQVESFKKILMALMDDPRVILIKLADRLHNMRTLDFMRPEKQLKIASETSWIYAPLAHRLGLYAIKTELEDLAMKYLEPEIYKNIALKLIQNKKSRNSFINDFIKPIKDKLIDNGFKNFQIYGRPKSIFSIWNKMKSKSVSFDEIYDLFAIRIILENKQDRMKEVAECWRVYSIIRTEYSTVSSRLRDWLSEPKSNGYEALHTTVMSHEGRWVEVQIKTERMEAVAEKGVAAHFKYKNIADDNQVNFEAWFNEIRDALNQSDIDNLEFLQNIKNTLLVNEVYVYTPKGDIKKLPANCSVLDFAFCLHTRIGLSCIGAKVNHKLVSIDTKLKNGDQIEIINSAMFHPQKEWLNFVVTNKAKQDINSFIQKENKTLSNKGLEMLNQHLNKIGLKPYEHNYKIIVKYYNLHTIFELGLAIAEGSINIYEINNLPHEDAKLIKLKLQENPATKIIDIEKITVLNPHNVNFELADCCKPIFGDDIFAYYTEESKLLVHRISCFKAPKLLSVFGNKIVKTKWIENNNLSFLIGLKLNGVDGIGLVFKISTIISKDMEINMAEFSFNTENGIFNGKIKFYVKSKLELDTLISHLKKIKEIQTIERIIE